jgi:phage tail tape-measure protein
MLAVAHPSGAVEHRRAKRYRKHLPVKTRLKVRCVGKHGRNFSCWEKADLVTLPVTQSGSSFRYRSKGYKEASMKLTGMKCVVAGFLLASIGCSGPLTTREKGAGIGALGGAAAGGIIGSAVGHAGAGAAIGSVLGLGAGALVGDQLQGQEQTQSEQQRQIDANQAELDRQRRELERLRRQGEY